MKRLNGLVSFIVGSLVFWAAHAQALTFTFLKIAESGDVPAGSPGSLQGYYNDPAADDEGNVAFEGNTTNALATGTDDTVVGYVGGALKQIHRDNDLVPGTTVTNYALDDHIEIRGGIAAFFGRSTTGSDVEFIATSDGTTSRIVATEGVTVLPSAGSPVISNISNAEGFGFDGTRLAFAAIFAGGSGVYLEDGFGGLSKIVDTTDTAPGGAAFTGFGNAMPDANGPGVVFYGDTAGGRGIFLSAGGTITNIADYSDYPAVSPDVDIVAIGEPDIDNGQVVFSTRQIDYDAPVFSPAWTPAASVEFYDGTTVTTIVDQSTVLPTGTTSVDFSEAAIANGTIAFASQDSNSGSSQTAVFVWRDGVLHKVVAIGDTIDSRVVTGIGTFNRPFLADGYLALELRFDSGARGIFRVTVVDAPIEPVLRWDLEEGGGTNTREVVSGIGNAAALINGPTWTNGLAPGSSAAVQFANTTPGSYINAGTLDTNGLYGPTNLTGNGQEITGEWTITAWVNIPAGYHGSADRCILTSDTAGGQAWWLFFVRDWVGVTNSLGFDFNSVRRDSLLSIPSGRPAFVSISADSSGAAFGGNTCRFALWDGSSWQYHLTNRYENLWLNGLEIGSFNTGTRQFTGGIDDVRIYSNALSDAELHELALSAELGGSLGGSVALLSSSVPPTSLTFRVTFSESVQLLDASDFDVSGSGTATGAALSVTGSGNVYTTVVQAAGMGELMVDLIPGAGVQTLGGDPLVYHAPAFVDIDNVPPAVTNIIYYKENPTARPTLYFDVELDEMTTGLGETNVEVQVTGSVTHTNVQVAAGGYGYGVEVSGVSGTGTIQIAIVANGSAFQDLSGNVYTGSFAGPLITRYDDFDPPTVLSITPVALFVPAASNEAIVEVAFSEGVEGFDSFQDVVINADTNWAQGWWVNIDDGGAPEPVSNYLVRIANLRVADGVSNATLTVAISLTNGVTDTAGLPLASTVTSAVITVSANSYQLWALSYGLTAGVNFGYTNDPDGDLNNNAAEFMRATDPTQDGDIFRRRILPLNIEGTNYFTYTLPVPVAFVFEQDYFGNFVAAFYDGTWRYVDVGDRLDVTDDLLAGQQLNVRLLEVVPALDGPVPGHPDLPPLPDTHEYRTLRWEAGTDAYPVGFIRLETLSGVLD